jgi:hypothetical protein
MEGRMSRSYPGEETMTGKAIPVDDLTLERMNNGTPFSVELRNGNTFDIGVKRQFRDYLFYYAVTEHMGKTYRTYVAKQGNVTHDLIRRACQRVSSRVQQM